MTQGCEREWEQEGTFKIEKENEEEEKQGNRCNK